MEFRKFTSIENHYREKYITILHELGYDQKQWIVHEKIHGANLSFITNGTEVLVAARNSVTDDNFYAAADVFKKYKELATVLKNTEFPDASSIQIYGELYGPGIQKGVYYGDQKDFVAFDLTVDNVPLDWNVALTALTAHGFKTAPCMGTFESLNDALMVSAEFKSQVAEAPGDNFAEGVVIKPVTPLRTPNGSRVMIKKKHPKFAEKIKRDNIAAAPNPFVDIAMQYINQNRVDAVLSKEGEITQSDFGRILQLVASDVIIDMIKDGDLPEQWRKQDEYKLAGKGVNTAVASFLKEHVLPTL